MTSGGTGRSARADLHAAHLYFNLPCGQGLQSAHQDFSLPCGQGLQSAQMLFRLPCGQGLHRISAYAQLQSAHQDFSLPCGQGLQSAQLLFTLAMRAGVAVRAFVFQLAMRAGVAVRAPVFPPPMRAALMSCHHLARSRAMGARARKNVVASKQSACRVFFHDVSSRRPGLRNKVRASENARSTTSSAHNAVRWRRRSSSRARVGRDAPRPPGGGRGDDGRDAWIRGRFHGWPFGDGGGWRGGTRVPHSDADGSVVFLFPSVVPGGGLVRDRRHAPGRAEAVAGVRAPARGACAARGDGGARARKGRCRYVDGAIDGAIDGAFEAARGASGGSGVGGAVRLARRAPRRTVRELAGRLPRALRGARVDAGKGSPRRGV